jgi:nickel-dependent lactate racemase
MKQVKLAYGKNGVTISVPNNAVVIEPRNLAGIEDEREKVLGALRNPIGALPLKDIANGKERIAIVISDSTRPTPNYKLVPWILEELADIPKDKFVIINGTGSHRANTKEELIQMLGQEIVDTVKVINHDAFNDDELVLVGTNSYGSKVYLNKTYAESDCKIVLGFIEPHFFAGFSGGPKGINPGIAGIRTILDFHNAKMVGHPSSTWGLIEGNTLQDAATQNCLLAKPDFMLNVTLNDNKEITNVFAGDVIAAHRVGCEFVREHAMYAVDAPFDIVITTNSGYPLDQNLYQTVKGMSAASQIVKKGGSIISVSECSDGVPDHGNYGKILQMRDTPQKLLEMINDESFSVFDQWQVQAQAMVQMKADCYLYSTLPPDIVRKAMLEPVCSVEETIANLLAKYGKEARLAVMPLGPLTIPYVK